MARGRSFVLVLMLVVAAMLAGSGCGRRDARPGPHKRLVVLGIDGMDPQLTTKLMNEGRLPNMSALAARGSFTPLGTSTPPESPVAWSDFITGQHSDGHGIYDFVHRDRDKLAPYLSTSRVSEPRTTLRVGALALPLGGGKVELLRGGRPFWSYLGEAGVPAALYMIPASYPPEPAPNVRVLAGMGTPDLLGTYGVFQLFTDDPQWRGQSVAGGEIHEIAVERGSPVSLALLGPPNPLAAAETRLSTPLVVTVDERAPVALVQLGGQDLVLKPGEWTSFVPIAFEPAPFGAAAIHGMVRLYLKAVEPHVALYVSPVNLDPLEPAQPFATPDTAEQLASAVGRFHTLGIPEDTKALESGVLSDAEFLDQARAVLSERERVLGYALDRFDDGVLFIYFGSIDQLSHTFWRATEPDAPEDLRPFRDTLASVYERIDRVVGDVTQRIGDTPLVVMSDHGFASYRTKFNLNTWLQRHGYLVLKGGASETGEGEPLEQVDWSKTRAYALGLNLLYVNLEGREAHGIVPAGERDALVAELSLALEGLRDPVTGDAVITKMVAPARGAYPERAPDLVVGYGRGYRSSDASAVGAVTAALFESNRDRWRGDHCMDASLVPGLLATTLPVDVSKGAELVDLAPTILDYFGVQRPGSMVGRSLLGHQP